MSGRGSELSKFSRGLPQYSLDTPASQLQLFGNLLNQFEQQAYAEWNYMLPGDEALAWLKAIRMKNELLHLDITDGLLRQCLDDYDLLKQIMNMA